MYFVFIKSVPGDSDAQDMSDVWDPWQTRKW